MKKNLIRIFHGALIFLGIKPSDEELELDRICELENQKVYRQLEIDLEVISKGDKRKKSI